MFSVEFGLVTLIALFLFAVVGEFLRISLYDQILARATHLERPSGGAAAGFQRLRGAVSGAFANDGTARWLFDENSDGTVAVGVTTADGWPADDANEVQVAISWDGDPSDGVGLERGRRRAVRRHRLLAARAFPGGRQTLVRPVPRAAPNGVVLNHESWARNNRS